LQFDGVAITVAGGLSTAPLPGIKYY